MQLELDNTINQFHLFPGTRYMGSKNKIIADIWYHLKDLDFDSALDAFAGSNVVSYFLKCKGKKVITNDFMAFSYYISKAIIENSKIRLDEDDIKFLIKKNKNNAFIQNTFCDIFFSNEDNIFLDRVRYNIGLLKNKYKIALALSSLARACIKKRARGIFTFVGERYNDGRSDLQKTIEEHFIESIHIFNKSVFDNGHRNHSNNEQSESFFAKADLVYIDPPYYTPKSDNDYVRRYHFVEGLVKNWKNLQIQEHSIVKKFESYKSPFAKKETSHIAIENLFQKYHKSKIVLSYSSNSLPTKNELLKMLKKYKSKVIVHEINHTYTFGNQKHKIGNSNNRVKEYLFIGI